MDEQSLAISSDKPAGQLNLVTSIDGHVHKETIPILEREIVKIGRDPRSNTLAILKDCNSAVSRNHCEIYVVVYEPSVNHIYVRDRKSSNGTYVNGKLIGIGPTISPGYLLEHGDVIEIRPHWRFTLIQSKQPPCFDMTGLQQAECRLFADKYRITRRCLGRGADGSVYLAIEPSTGRQLVCKVVNLGSSSSHWAKGALWRKIQEADTLRQLQHPNILPYIEAISSPHSLFIFTELASGGDLMSFIHRHNGVKEFDTRIIVRQVIRGLAYLHMKGVVHRDLKPENILLAYSPKIAYHRVMLSDFGTCAVPQRSRMRTTVGTYSYQAPEVLDRSRVQTFAVDIWSLGIVTMQMLAAAVDFDFSKLNSLTQDKLNSMLRHQVFKSWLKLSKSSKFFVWQCLQVSPEDRMTVLQAECHDWLCTPEKHQEFFERLDRRMLSSWQAPKQLIPLPMQLPSVLLDIGLVEEPVDDFCEPQNEQSAFFRSSQSKR